MDLSLVTTKGVYLIVSSEERLYPERVSTCGSRINVLRK